MGGARTHDVEAIFQTQTDKGFCVRSDETSKTDIWLAKSTCSFKGRSDKPFRGDVVLVTAPEYILKEKGLI